MFIFKKKRVKKDIPYDLRLELRELQERKRIEGPTIKFSISASDDTVKNAVNDIKKTKLKPTFKEVLFSYIDSKKLTDPEVYKKAKVDKRTFSKLRTGENNYVSKKTAICLGLALELNQKDFDNLLNANLSYLGDNEYFDIAIKWCIKNKIYDIEQVNDILYACDLSLLTK